MSDEHDQRFKALLKLFFPNFVQLFFAGLSRRLDLNQVQWLEQELFSDPPLGDKKAVDLLARVPLKTPLKEPNAGTTANPNPAATAKPNGSVTTEPEASTTVDPGVDVAAESTASTTAEPEAGTPAASNAGLVLVHIEVESSSSVEAFRRRMFEYWSELRKKHRESQIYPIALYLRVGLQGIGREVYQLHLPSATGEGEDLRLQFWYEYIGLPGLSAVEYLGKGDVLAAALSALMKSKREEKISLAIRAMQQIYHSERTAYEKYLLLECVEAYAPQDEEQREELRRQQAKGGDPMKLTADLLLEQGEALAEARAEAKFRAYLVKLLERRFGVLSQEQRQQLESLTGPALEAFGERLLDTSSLQELFSEKGSLRG